MTQRTVSVVEVSPRDGLQNESGSLDADAKVELITRAVDAGLSRVEVGSFVSARAVPQMADTDAVVQRLRHTPAWDGIASIGLVVNRRGVDRAIEAGVHEVNAVVVATDTFSRRNQGKSTSETLQDLPEVLVAARRGGLRTSVTIATAFGCPFEGEVPVDRLSEVADAVAATEPDEVCLADTIGVAVPSDVTQRVGEVRRRIGAAVGLRAHFHNTRNTGYANAVAAVEAGVSALDASLGGIGGCPFAPNATGNLATEDLVYLLERMGLGVGVDLDRAIEASAWLAQALGHEVPGLLSKAGGFPAPA